MNSKPNSTGALGALTASMLIFGTIGLFRRWIPVSSGLLSLTRAVLGTAFLLGYVGVRGRNRALSLNRRQGLLLLLSGALIGFNWIALFEAYRFTTVAVATLCYYMQPTILILLSPLLFGERLGMRKLLCAAAAVAGMVLVSGVGTVGAGNGRGIALGLTAAGLYAAVIVLNKLVSGVDPLQRTVVQLSAAALTLLPYVLLTEDWGAVALTGAALGALLLVGLVHTGVAYALYFSSVEHLSAQTIALMSYVDPVSALLFSALLLREPLGLRGAAGAALILSSAALGELLPQAPERYQDS